MIALMYHDVVAAGRDDASGFPGGDSARYKLTPHQFDEHLSAIRAVSARAHSPVVLTFDDGGVSAMHVADRLETFGWRGTFFMTGAYVDRPGFLTRQDLCELRRRGHGVGTHSFSHPLRMAHLPLERMRDEWERGIVVLREILGEPVTTASVPGGDYSRRVARTAEDAGIRILFTSTPVARCRAVGQVSVSGRFVIQRSTSPDLAAAVATGAVLPRLRQLASWEMRRLAKTAAGGAYLAVRGRLLGRSPSVRWGDGAR